MRKTVIFVLCVCLSGCGTVKKMLKREPKEETTQTVLNDEAAGLPKSLSEPAAGVLRTPVTFLPSYRNFGGPHLKIDSLNTVLYLDENVFQSIERYIESEKKSGMTDSLKGKSTVRYYATNYSANDLLADEISQEKARGMPHFKGVFDNHGNLKSLEFFGEQTVSTPNVNNLKPLYASYWNILTNRRINYLDKDGNRPEPHVKFYSDPGKIVHRIEYINNNEIIASGDFTFGVKQMILEQRILFPKGGKLTDLHPDFFYRQYDRVESGWVVKCLYEQKDKLSDLIIMQDNGVIFYRYRFIHESIRNQRVIEVFVYNSTDEIVGRYELYFDDAGDLHKKILISDDRKITAYSVYSIDIENLKVIVNNFDPLGNHISRIYRDL
ncbi:MAG: hypothetical protein JXR87_04715 [Candidatus Marinimicrobia bacterium]|nr:hypothetical protein [Candidatus Neomarinimicrobiota bacterium]